MKHETILETFQHLLPHQVAHQVLVMGDEQILNVQKAPEVVEVDEPTFVRLAPNDFHNGTLEVKLLSRLKPDAPDFARGFIGLTFRINEDNSKFEGVYIRPTNGRADDQIRRNHSVQYFSYPNHKFDTLRRMSPEKYETYADMGLNEWIDFKLVIRDQTVQLFLNGSKQPVLVVYDMKHGSLARGSIGCWVDVGTDGFFKDLRITPED